MANWNIIGNSTGEMIITMEGEEWQNAKAAAKERLVMRSNQVGTDPKNIEKSDIAKVALNQSIQTLYERGIAELGLEPVSEPIVEMRELKPEYVTVAFIFSVMPEIRIGDLGRLKYNVEPVKVTLADIDAEIDELKKSLASQGQNVPDNEDEFAKGFGIEGVDTMDALKANINDALVERRNAEAAQAAEDKLLDDLCAICDFEAPDGMVDMEIDSLIAADKDKVASMNGQWEDFLKSARKTEESLREEYRPEASRSIKIRLILDKISSDNNLEPTAEEIENEYNVLAEAYHVPIEDFRNAISEDDIRYQKRLVMAMDFIKK